MPPAFDTDNDGLEDGKSLMDLINISHTRDNADTDGDGLNDGNEVLFILGHGRNNQPSDQRYRWRWTT